MSRWTGRTDKEIHQVILGKLRECGGCLLWTGSVSGGKYGGYGRIRQRGNTVAITRFLWEWFNGPIPEGQVIRHSCDNPRCCNIEHLEIGTLSDNAQDCVKRGRHVAGGGSPPGERAAKAKLCDEKVILARYLSRKGVSYEELARRLKVGPDAVRFAVLGRTWKHIDMWAIL